MIRFSATASPSGLTFVGSNGRTYAIPSSAAAYATARDKVRALKAAFSAPLWAELTKLADPTVGPFFVGAKVKVANGPTATVVSNNRGNVVVEATPKAKAPRDIDRTGSGDPQQPSAKPRKPAPPKPSKPKPPAGGVKLPASLAAMESAETMIHLGALAGSQHGFQTGIENYAQAAWGTEGLNAAMSYFRDPTNYGQRKITIANYQQDNEGFMRGLSAMLFGETPTANKAQGVPDDERKAAVEHLDVVGNKWVDENDTRGFDEAAAKGYIARQPRPQDFRLKGDDKALQAVIDVRLTGGKHIYGGVFEAVNVVVNGEVRKTFSGENLSGHRQALDYCEKTFGFDKGDLTYLRANANFVMPLDDVKLREIFGLGTVNVILRGFGVKSYRDYQPAAQYLKDTYGFDDGDLMAIYHDYKADYDGVSDDEDED